MSQIPDSFRGLRIRKDEQGYRAAIEGQTLDQLNAGEVVIRTQYSSVNYKDALAGTGKGKILRQFPLNGGIDVAGEVLHSDSSDFKPGDSILVTGCGLSEDRDGGYSEIVRLAAKDVIALPQGLSSREAMIIGTAGFTAALSLYRMEANGQTPEMGPVVVTGATGGVGMLAIDILTRAGYEAHAISGKEDRFQSLVNLGAKQCLSRRNLHWGQRPLESTHWAGAIDSVGGEMLAGLTRVIEPYGSIACCGLAGGHELHTTVMPFILRGVSLLGIASAGTARAIREILWQRLASDWKPAHLEAIATREVTLEQLPDVFETMLEGDSFGRTVVRIGG